MTASTAGVVSYTWLFWVVLKRTCGERRPTTVPVVGTRGTKLPLKGSRTFQKPHSLPMKARKPSSLPRTKCGCNERNRYLPQTFMPDETAQTVQTMDGGQLLQLQWAPHGPWGGAGLCAHTQVGGLFQPILKWAPVWVPARDSNCLWWALHGPRVPWGDASFSLQTFAIYICNL